LTARIFFRREILDGSGFLEKSSIGRAGKKISRRKSVWSFCFSFAKKICMQEEEMSDHQFPVRLLFTTTYGWVGQQREWKKMGG